jgi:hypothetical protein
MRAVAVYWRGMSNVTTTAAATATTQLTAIERQRSLM